MLSKTETIRIFSTDFLTADSKKCRACWRCLTVCSNKVIGKVGFLWHRHIKINDPGACTGCMKCVEICPHGAIKNLSSQTA